MKYYCRWVEKATVLQNCSGWVEAESKEDAKQELLKGNAEIDDCFVWDELDSTVTNINSIEEDND